MGIHERIPRISVALAAVGLIAAACGGGSSTGNGSVGSGTTYSPQAGVSGGKLIYSDWEPVNDLNYFSSSAATTVQGTNAIASFLWVFDPTNQPVPDLVSEIPTVSNGDVKQIDSKHMDVTIKLKDGLKWSDGTPLTTDDLSYTIDAICDPDSGAPGTVGYDHISSVENKSSTVQIWHFGPETTKSNTSVSPATYRCGLSSTLDSGIYAPYLLLSFQPLPKHTLSSVAHKDFATAPYFTTKPTVTSGPYMVQSFTPGASAQLVMVPNPHYFDGRSGATFFGHKPYLDQLIYKIYGDKSSQIAGLRAGDTDLGLDLIAADLTSLNTITQDKTEYISGLLDEFLTMNVGNNTKGCEAQHFALTCGTATVFKDDQTLRQALGLAVDKDLMVKQLVGGIGVTMNSPLMHTFTPWYDTSRAKFVRDLTKANSMLDSDGWVKAADGTRSKNGRKLAFVISTTAGNTQRANEEELLISNFKDVGATVTTSNFPAGNFFAPFQSSGILATGQYDMALFADNWAPDPDSWASFAISTQIPTAANPSGANWGRWNDPKLDSLFAAGENSVDVNTRKSTYNQMQAEWETYQGAIELYERPDVFTHSTTFGNFAANGGPNLGSWNSADWFKKTSS